MKLNNDMSNEACMTYLLKHMENNKKEGQASGMLSKIQKALNCDVDNILPRIER